MPGTPSLPLGTHATEPRPHPKSPRSQGPCPWDKEKWDLNRLRDREVVKKRPGGGWGKYLRKRSAPGP